MDHCCQEHEKVEQAGCCEACPDKGCEGCACAAPANQGGGCLETGCGCGNR